MKKVLTALFISIMVLCIPVQVAFAANDDTPTIDQDRTYGYLNRELDRTMDWVNKAPNTELDKIMAFYEYMCLNYDYDYDFYNHLKKPEMMIATKKGICSNYASHVFTMSDRMDFASEQITADPTEDSIYDDGHAWNIVQVDGAWYYFDTTWGGISPVAGSCNFGYFLRSRYSDPHVGMFESTSYSESLKKCTSTRFDNAWWNQTVGMEALAQGCVPMPYDGAWYYVNRDYQIIKRTTAAETAEVTVFRDSGQDGINIGTQIAIKNGKLFFMGNTSGTNGQVCFDIYQVDIDTNSEPVKVFTSDDVIQSFGLKNNAMYYNVSGNTNIPVTIPDINVPPTDLTITQEETRYGDFVESIRFSAEVGPDNATNKKVDWAFQEYSGVVDKDGNWRAICCTTNPQYSNLYAFTEEGPLYEKINVTVPYAEGIGEVPYIINTFDTEGNPGLYWPKAKNATKYVISRWHTYPYYGRFNKSSESVPEWIGESTDNYFALDENTYNKEYVYGVTPVNYSGMGGLQKTSYHVCDYGPESIREEIIDYPRNVDYEQVCKGTFRFTWDAVEGADIYTVSYLAVDSEQQHKDFKWVTSNETEAIVTGLEENKDYYVFVSARNSNSNAGNYGSTFLRIHVNEMTCKPYLTKTEAVPAQCEWNGSEAYYTCDICGKYYSDSEGVNEIEKDSWVTQYLGHDPGEMYIEEGQEATCYQAGYYYECIECNRCGKSLRHERITIPRLDHNIVWVEGDPPTCVGSGTADHWKCTTCGNTFSDEEGQNDFYPGLPPTGHNLTYYGRVEPTCTDDGHEEYWQCENCHNYYFQEDALQGYYDPGLARLEATGHSWDNGTVTTEATCSAEGVKTFHCTKCDATRTEPIEIDADAHDWNAPTYEWSDDNASVTATRVCNHNDAHTETETVAVTSGETKAPTCTAEGEMTFTSAAFTNKAFEVQIKKEAIPKTEHPWDEGEVTTEPTCKSEGVRTFRCTKCDATRTEPIAVNESAHEWDDGVTTPSGCNTEGSTLYTCKLCGATNSVAIDPTGHTAGEPVPENIVEATCTADGGYDEVVYCTACGDELTRGKKTIPATHHQGTMQHIEAVPGTCLEGGSSEYWHCTKCEMYFADADGDEIIAEGSWLLPAPGHKWNTKYTVDKKATYAAKGSKSIHCSVCNVKKPGSAVAIPKLVVKATTLSKLTPAKKAITVKWKKGSSITGYQIQYALNSKFTSGKKTVTITKAGTVSKKITKLKAKKKYYVRVRTYKTVSGKKYYSTWSKYKYTKTK